MGILILTMLLVRMGFIGSLSWGKHIISCISLMRAHFFMLGHLAVGPLKSKFELAKIHGFNGLALVKLCT